MGNLYWRSNHLKKKIKSPIKRKCHNCGKMATNPLVCHVVPPLGSFEEMPIYRKSDIKIDRSDLKGKSKIQLYNYCDVECCNNHNRI
jgi:hypothetical protein